VKGRGRVRKGDKFLPPHFSDQSYALGHTTRARNALMVRLGATVPKQLIFNDPRVVSLTG